MSTRDLEAVLQQFHVTREELLQMLQLEPGDVVYVSGSLVEGYGNPYSDLDLFVLKERIADVQADAVHGDHVVQILVIGNNRFDVEYYEHQTVREYLNTARQFESDSNEHMMKLNVSKIDFLHRLRIAIPLAGAETLEALQAELDRERICGSLKNWRMRCYNAHLMDCTGMLEINDLDTAVDWARRTLGDALDVVLALQLDTNPSEKWRYRKLERAFGVDSEIYLKYRHFMTCAVVPDERANFIEEILMYAGDLVLEAQWQAGR